MVPPQESCQEEGARSVAVLAHGLAQLVELLLRVRYREHPAEYAYDLLLAYTMHGVVFEEVREPVTRPVYLRTPTRTGRRSRYFCKVARIVS